MSDFVLDMALDHYGFDEDQKTRIRAFIPKAAYIATLVKSNKTVINETIDVAEIIFTQLNKQGAQT